VIINQLWVVFVIFLAVFTQSLSGFGFALVAMALLPSLISVQIATPLVALVAISIEAYLMYRYREALNLGVVWPIALASLVGIPIGVWTLKGVDEATLLTVLGVVITGYALYALLRFKLPELRHPVWAWGAGFLAGILGGAYNVSGPPVIIYSDCRRWPPREFKSNLQGFFVVSSTFIALSHAVSRNLTSIIWEHYLWALPAMALGVIAGTSLDRFLNPTRFRRIVLVILVIMGLRLIFLS
jgi:uncharacterized membrane protein YfcA